MRFSIVIPCLNEERTVTRVVSQAATIIKKLKLTQTEIIVADNGSSDDSVLKLTRQGLARIVHVPVRGYGAALHWGMLHARGQYVIYADADLSYSFLQLSRFIHRVGQRTGGKPDLVLGSRFRGEIKPEAMPWLHRYVGTPILTFLIRVMYGLPTTDCNSGMRMVRKAFYQKLNMNNAGMEWASELLIKTALAGGQYQEVPITLYPDQRGRNPHLVAWSDGWRHLKAIVLLKPNILFVASLGCFMLGLIGYFKSFTTAVFFLSTGITLFFCTLAAKLLKYALDGKESRVSRWLLHFQLVPISMLLFFLSILQFFIIPSQFQYMKIILLHVILLCCLWVFFIETIKTHLVNKLPHTIKKI